MRNYDKLVPNKEISDDNSSKADLIDLTRLSGYEILELAKGKYGKRDGDGSPFSLSDVIATLIAGILFLIFMVVFIVGPMLVDPMFLYVPTINENIKCLALDEKLKKAVIVLRSFTDVPFLLGILHHVLLTSPFRRLAYLQAALDVPERVRGVLPKSLMHNILAVLPIPQTFMQAISRQSDIGKQMTGIYQQIKFMLHEYGLPAEIQDAIEKLVREALEEDDDLVVKNIFSVLPWELQKHIKRHLFLATLKKLPGLENKDRQVLDAIMEHLEPVNCADGSYIIREGEPLDRMIFITQGTALVYKTSTTGGESGSSSTTHLAKGDVYGKELCDWAATSTTFSGLPISDKTVKSHENVEVFAIWAAKLQCIIPKPSTHYDTELPHLADSTTGETHVEIP